MPAQYGAVCIEIQNPSAFIVRFLDAKKEKDVRMKWEKVEEGKYRISYKDREAFFYDYMKDADPKRPYLIFMMSLKGVKPLESDDDYTNLTKLNNSPTLDDCTTYKREEMNQDPDPGPDN
ncbi:hypothetical protein LEP1GSC044_3725 [Leptospira kirschneri serovar Grippotyphosa str. RM52]|nr:hypothetical protein LEP1GSC044_3725 [Leptospira kirschneri serovar Grippotyphosa str. RM52]EMK05615.1 hypothetical protein LEP1GSC176_2189 [Leptospira kirschneri str. MMD1493]